MCPTLKPQPLHKKEHDSIKTAQFMSRRVTWHKDSIDIQGMDSDWDDRSYTTANHGERNVVKLTLRRQAVQAG